MEFPHTLITLNSQIFPHIKIPNTHTSLVCTVSLLTCTKYLGGGEKQRTRYSLGTHFVQFQFWVLLLIWHLWDCAFFQYLLATPLHLTVEYIEKQCSLIVVTLFKLLNVGAVCFENYQNWMKAGTTLYSLNELYIFEALGYRQNATSCQILCTRSWPQLSPMYIPAVIMIAISLEMKVMYNAQNQYTKFRLQSTFM